MSRTRDIVVRTLAEGGMGRVDLLLRTQGDFQRLFALKRLKPALSDDAELRAMFLREAKLAGLIRHPNVAAVIDVGEDESGPFLLMEYVEGVTASALARWSSRADKRLPVQICAEIIRQAASGLDAAHRLRSPAGQPLEIVHRDVSPQNILLGFDGVVRVTDFGIAKALDGGAKTSTGVLKGKLGYMAPEQLRFEPVDHRADLFSLGVVFFELLSGKRLFDAKDPRMTARRILDEQPPDIDEHRDDVHPSIVELLFQLLARDPARRPSDADAVARVLAAVGQELAREEGLVRLDDFLRAEFTEEAETIQAEIRALQATHTIRARPKGRLVAAIAAAVVVVGGGALGIAAAVDGDDPALGRAPEPLVDRAPAIEPAAPSFVGTASLEPPAASDPPDAGRARAPRAVRGRARPAASMKRQGGLDSTTWDWE